MILLKNRFENEMGCEKMNVWYSTICKLQKLKVLSIPYREPDNAKKDACFFGIIIDIS